MLSHSLYCILTLDPLPTATSIGFLEEEKSEVSSKGLLNLFVICIWQFYLYMISDGFKYSTFHTDIYKKIKCRPGGSSSSGKGGTQKMFKYAAIMSIIYIITNFITIKIKDKNCEKLKNNDIVNNIKEIQINILLTTIVAFLMILTISGTKR